MGGVRDLSPEWGDAPNVVSDPRGRPSLPAPRDNTGYGPIVISEHMCLHLLSSDASQGPVLAVWSNADAHGSCQELLLATLGQLTICAAVSEDKSE